MLPTQKTAFGINISVVLLLNSALVDAPAESQPANSQIAITESSIRKYEKREKTRKTTERRSNSNHL